MLEVVGNFGFVGSLPALVPHFGHNCFFCCLERLLIFTVVFMKQSVAFMFTCIKPKSPECVQADGLHKASFGCTFCVRGLSVMSRRQVDPR